jgi:hypothetical protein
MWTDIGAVEAPDSLVNGATIGAIIGGLAGGVPPAIFAAVYGDCPCGRTNAAVVGLASLGAAIGGSVGALADRLNGGRRDLYRHTPSVSIAPALIGGRIGVSGALRW